MTQSRHPTVASAIDDSVNTASRVESLTKTFARELVISEAGALRAGIDFGAAPRHEIKIRGRDERLVVRTFTNFESISILRHSSRKIRVTLDSGH